MKLPTLVVQEGGYPSPSLGLNLASLLKGLGCMTFEIRTMQDNEAQIVAGMVHGLARDLSLNIVPALTGQVLLESLDLVNVVVAAEAGKLLGACLSLMTFSTFRGGQGRLCR